MRATCIRSRLESVAVAGLSVTAVTLSACDDVSDLRRVSGSAQLSAASRVAHPVEMRPLYDWRVRVQLRESAKLVVRDSAAWQEIWLKASEHAEQEVTSPQVDFGNERVVVLALGARPQLAYGVSIDSAVSHGDSLVVFATERVSDCPSGAAVTYPTDMVALRTVAGVARFEVDSTGEPCS